MIRLAVVVLVALAVWRTLARRSGETATVTVVTSDGSSRTLTHADPLGAQLLALADTVAP